MSTKPIIKSLPVKLKDNELLHYGRLNAQAAADLSGIEYRKKQFASECKAESEGIHEEVSRRNMAINRGEESREVECFEEMDRREGVVRLIRTDLHTVVSTRPMTADEYQTSIKLFDVVEGGE